MTSESSAVPPRPWEVVAVLFWVGLSWVAVIMFNFVPPDAITGKDMSYMLISTVILGLWMWRVWHGGPMAVGYMQKLLSGLGVFAPGGVLLLVAFLQNGFEMRGILEDWPASPYSRSESREVFEDWPALQFRLAVRTLPLIVYGVVSFTLSRMLGRPIVRAWISARADAGRPDAGA